MISSKLSKTGERILNALGERGISADKAATTARDVLLEPLGTISKREWSVAFLLFALFAGLFGYFQIVTVWHHNLDTAFLMEVLVSIRETGVPTTYLGPSFVDAFSTFSQEAEALCKEELAPSGRGLSVLDSHAYYILYPLAVLTWILPPHIILAVANGLGFASIIFIVYWIVRKQGVSIAGALIFCFLVIAHPAWSHASLGDLYADRFFMPLGLLYAFLLYDAISGKKEPSRNYWVFLIVAGALAASTTERAAIMIAAFTAAILVFYWKDAARHKARVALALFVVVLLVHVVVYVKYLHVHHEGTGSIAAMLQNLGSMIERFEKPDYVAGVKEYLVINVVFLGLFSIANWRLAIIALFAIMPNIFTTIGGAEKTGWGTHYHSMYFPFLVLAASMGYGRIWLALGRDKYRLFLMLAVVILIPAISGFSAGYGDAPGAVKRMYMFYTKGNESYESYLTGQLEQIENAVPPDVTVTTPEGFIPTLYLDRTINYYPVGIDTADYAVLYRKELPDGSYYYGGAVSYIGKAQEVNMCLSERLGKAGYDLDQPELVLDQYAVLKRRNN